MKTCIIVNTIFLSRKFVNTAFLSRKFVNTAFLSRKFVSQLVTLSDSHTRLSEHAYPPTQPTHQTKCYLYLPKISDLPLQLNSCWNNHPFLHLDAISDLVSMTELFLPARQGFTCPTHRPRPAPCEHNNRNNSHCKSIPRANMWTFYIME